jgi:GNAT superfamily N-acetyltransferase
VFWIQSTGGAKQIGIRQASRADCAAIGQFMASLSPKTRYLRFFSGAPSVSSAMLRRMAGEGGNVDVVVATEDGAIIGHAMAAGTSGPAGARVAEIGVVVTDTRQGRGLGRALTRELAERARAHGASTVSMDVLAENRRALAMIDRAWPAAHYQRSGPYLTIQASLTPLDEGPAETRPEDRPSHAKPGNSPSQSSEEQRDEPVPSC